MDQFEVYPLDPSLQRKYWVFRPSVPNNWKCLTSVPMRMDERIVSIQQPHVRPIVRGKARFKTEFGAKIHLSLVDGYSFLDTISWDAFNEGSCLKAYVENYRQRFGFYPAKVLADKIYCSRENRKWLKDNGIKLAAKPLGRPSAEAVENHVRPGERNPIEGKFGQAKTGSGMNRIKAGLKDTSQSWIAAIILLLKMVKLAGEVLLCLSFSAWATFNYALIAVVEAVYKILESKNQFRLNSGLVLRI